MNLRELLPDLHPAPPALEVGDLGLDSSRLRPGSLFLALRGTRRHGLDFLADALARGAAAVAWEPEPGLAAPRLPPGVVGVPVPGLRARLGDMADRFFARPSARMHVHGITGTNGKTTTAWLMVQALLQLGRRPGYVGTLGAGLGLQVQADGLTTPDCVSLHRRLRAFADDAADFAVTEVSSHALAQGRVDGVHFRLAAFTNLSRDHLDYHRDMEAYGRAKQRLFLDCAPEIAVINVGDPFGRRLADGLAAVTRLLPVAVVADAAPPWDETLRVQRLGAAPGGQRLELRWRGEQAAFTTTLPGAFNAENFAVAAGMLAAEGLPLARIAPALAGCVAPPGRLERIGTGPGPAVFVDFAHTPDALARVLGALREVTPGRLWCVFGCGGDRDRGKRPLMGRVAAGAADAVVLTDDNPRGEDPSAIVAEITAAFPPGRVPTVIHDRAAAIRHAVLAARAEDVVLVAGKGHETTQVSADGTRPFSDQHAARAALAERS